MFRLAILTLTSLALCKFSSGDSFPIKNGLYVCNESGEKLNVAYAHRRDDIYVTHGWTAVEDRMCQQLTTNFASPTYYVYAVGSSGKTWEADHKFCIDPDRDFDIPYGDHTQGCKFKNFFSVWIPYLVAPIFPDHFEVVIGANNVGLNSAKAER